MIYCRGNACAHWQWEKLTVSESCQFQDIWLQQNANLSISSKWSTGVWGFSLVWSAVDIYQANQIQPAIPSLIPSFFANPWILGILHGQSSAQNQDKSHALTQGKLSVVFFCTTINYAWALEFLHTFSFGQSHGLSACGHAHKVTAQGQGKTEPEIDVTTISNCQLKFFERRRHFWQIYVFVTLLL